MDEKLTPMMKQYSDIKRKHPDDILFFRMGDFYEMFFDDAKIASKILDIALTARQNDIPMCGLPYHAAESYIARLIKAGKRVAVCEQLESVPSSGSIVKRDVVRIITPGTVIEQNLIASDDNNYLCSVYLSKKEMGISFVDISTGDFSYMTSDKNQELFRGELAKFSPREVIFHAESHETDSVFLEYIKNRNIPVHSLNEWYYEKGFMTDVISETLQVHSLKGLGIDTDIEIISVGSILQYLRETHKTLFAHLKNPMKLASRETMLLDEATVSNLELIQNQQDGSKNRTLFSVLNHTKTPMGRRALERNLLQPLIEKSSIEDRLGLVDFFYQRADLTEEINNSLKEILDMERLISRFTIGKVQPRNFIALKQSIQAAEKIHKTIAEHEINSPSINRITEGIKDLSELSDMIETVIHEEPALSPEQGRVIRSGYIPELDRLYELKSDAKSWILKYQEDEKSRLGINTLRVKYNKILGYYIEISKGQAENAPEEYMRKQTLVGGERFTTSELQKFESDILGASEKIIEIEKSEIEKLRSEIVSKSRDIQDTATAVGFIDFICSLAVAAIHNRFIRPQINDNNYVSIKGGRHPAVEKYYTKEVFIPNDVLLDDSENMISIITGPNMAGKSTYIRMCAIIQLLGQIGSFVPAESADISIADRIFTRIGASDNISRGESTFLVEMNETANILNNATERSLIIMDEVGRGTSTYDGLSIAWGVVEYIQRYIKAKTLFATHYHELTQLGNRNGIVNYNVLVKETLNSVEFLHKVVAGSADKSYGIHVAKLAGLPKTIISRSSKILEKLEKNGSVREKLAESSSSSEQLEIFNASNHLIIQTLNKIDVESLTPMDAINELYKLKKLID
ncbi:MAG TPA: DNA mismatch repair protein MutS [Spirochaetota bacterium]|nr:DNA mismatch repair protein MutS [Spirochaetota bacterium]HPJ34195.1 DNA mismatch repair protein MutS [Spirochaetota bacterium]